MELRVNDYVRTKDGKIINIQVLQIIKDINCDYVEINYEKILRNNIVKSSPNIIDLIEVGDFIGKTIVEEVKEFDDGTRIIVMADGFDEYDENEYFLKAGIVTKEQFESMEYKVGE